MSPTRNAATVSSAAQTSKGKVTAKTESQALAAANDGRVALIVTNKGANDVYLAFGAAAAKEEGPFLKKEGGAMVIDFWLGEVTCFAHEGESLVTFAEV